MQRTIRKTERGSRKQGSDPFIGMYLKEVSKIPLVTVEEERELGRRIQTGDLIAMQKLIESNLRFVIKIARKFIRRPDQFMELVNVGNLGLIEAARRFDPEMKVRFTTYAVWWIRQALFHHLAGMAHALRVSPKVANIVYRTARVLNHASLGLGEIPDREQLAEKVGVSVEELNSALGIMASTVSLDQPIHEVGYLRLSETIEQTGALSPEEQAMIESTRRSLQKSIEDLSPVEQKVIRLRFGLDDRVPMTLQEVGNKLNRSRERIRQIERDALRKLQNIYSTQTLNNYLN